MTQSIAVLGATGRTGRGIARKLAEAGQSVILVGRDAARLNAVAAELPGSRVVAGALDQAMSELSGEQLAVVVNTIGPFERTAPQAIDAFTSAHYVDLANDPIAFGLVLGREAAARAARRTLVTGAGFGVLATEAAAMHVVEGRPTAKSVRVDAMSSSEADGSPLGEALAATIIDGIGSMSRIPARERRDWPGFGSQRELVITPEGQHILSVGFPSGEYIAAARATGASTAFSASSEAPSSRLVPVVMPLALVALRSARLRRSLVTRMAAVPWVSREEPRPSWARARAEWADGTTRVAWLRIGDAMEFTIATGAEVALRLAKGEGRPGAFTPGALFGTQLALQSGGVFVD